MHALKNVRLHLIVGKTGVGKTARATQRAEATGAPVVVLDRIQCYPELAVGSGRPLDDQLRGTRRIYLTTRRVTDGDLDATAAHLLLMARVEQLASENDTIILEGGSMSLLQEMMKSPVWKGYRCSYEHLRGTDEESYRVRVLQRVRGMLRVPPGEKSILAEFAESWSFPEARAFVDTVVGYNAISAWCRENGVHPEELLRPLSPEQLEDLAQRITEAHLAYARMQEGVFEQMDAYWQESRYSGAPVRPTFMVAVFCGARSGENPALRESARVLGAGLARRGVGLIYGGAVTGMMGTLASACLDEGGFVEGVMPEALQGYEIAHPRLSSMIWTKSMAERKRLLIERADAFAILPGGIGTCDELFEVATGAQLGLHSKTTFVLNVEGYFDLLLRFVHKAIHDGFADEADAELLKPYSSADALLEAIGAPLAAAGRGEPSAEGARRRIQAAVRQQLPGTP